MKNSFKKFVSVMLTIAMLMSFMTFNASAEATLPAFAEGDSIYAGQQTITIKLAEEQSATELTAEQTELVKITRMDTGANIAFTSKITGDVLTIMPDEAFVINEEDATFRVSYLVELGEVKKIFTVNKIWEDSFDTAASKDITELDLKTDKYSNSKPDALAEGKIIYDNTVVTARNGAGTGIYPDDTAYESKENLSFSVKVQFLNKFPSYAVAFNVDREYGTPYYAGNQKFNGFGFHTYYGHSGGKWFNKYTHTNKPVYSYYDEANSIIKTTFTPAYSNDYVHNCRPLIELSEVVGTTPSINKWTDANYVVTEEMKDKNIFTLTVDKMGAVATLVQEGKLSPELSDAEESNYETYKTKISGIEATRDLVYVYDTADIEELSGKTIPTTGRFGIFTTGKNTVIAFYDMIITETEVSEYESGALTVKSVDADDSAITVNFDRSLVDITENDIKNNVKLNKNLTTEVLYSAEVAGDKVVLTPEDGVETDTLYSLNISEDFGYQNVKLEEAFNKMFKLEKIWGTDFNDTSKAPTDYFDKITNYRWNSKTELGGTNKYESVHSKTVIQGGKMYAQYLNAPAFWILDEAVMNAEDYTLTFDMARYNHQQNFSANWGVILNADVTKVPGEWDSIIYGSKNYTGFGWQNDVLRDNIQAMYVHPNKYAGTFGAEKIPFVSDNGATSAVTFNADGSVTLPEQRVQADAYKIVKKGKVMTLYINGALVNTYDTTADAASIYGSTEAPSKGGIILGSTAYDHAAIVNGAMEFGDITVTRYAEVEGIEELNVQAIDGDENSVKIIFDRELAGVSATDAGEAIKLIDSELKEIECEISIDGSVVTLKPDKSFEIDTVYGVKVAAGFGFNEYMTLDEYVQMFMIETVWKTSFATNSDVSSYFSTGNYRWTTGYDNTKSKFVVSNGKFYMQNVSTPAIWIMNDTVKNIENYVMTFDMAYYNHNNEYNKIDFGMLFNVDWSSETALGQWHYMQTSGTHSGFGWQYKIGQKQFVNIHKKTTASTVTTGTISNDMDLSTKGEDATLTFAEDGSVTPNTKVQADSYKIVKKGNVITLYVNDALIGTYDSTEDAKALYGENNVPTKGGIVLGMVQTDAKKIWENGGLEFGNIKISTFKTVDSFVAVPELLAEYNTGKINGTVKFVNYSGAVISNAKMIVAAYKNDELVGLTSYSLTNVSNESIKEVPYEITGLTEKPDEVRAFAWKDFETIKPLCSAKVESVN